MSDIMRPIPLSQLINWVYSEYKNEGAVFGIRKEKFFRPSSHNVEIFGKKTSTPIGPSAGPGTQLAQNILAFFLTGGRFMELKTVQTMDGEELRKALSRPSINAAEEGYNVEWSTELTVDGALEEYIKAWFLCHIFAVEFKICEKADVIFTMSAGYSLDGIKSEKIDSFIEGMKNAQNTEIWQRCYDQALSARSLFSNFTKADLDAVPPEISDRIILSTFYNCPPDETEEIASYFINKKALNTYIKCNPTLLGFETTRAMLDDMGYRYISFTDDHFKRDIQFNDAVKMLRSLKAAAAKKHIGFGVKLTNTLPVEIKRGELPGKEMYLSGRALFPLSIFTAKKISDAFHGEMPISYSGGADFFNLKAILETGLSPVTMTTNTLKPGGIERFTQLANIASGIAPNNKGLNVKALNALCGSVRKQTRYLKDFRRLNPRKDYKRLPVFDCAKAPCSGGCPVRQKIPEFLAAVSAGNYSGAFKIIAAENSAPSITAAICDQRCQQKCVRFDYEDPLPIKMAEKAAVDHAQENYILSLTAPEIKTDLSAAVIGAGPAGIAAALFLRRNGVPVTVYEKRGLPYGAVQYLIPPAKIPDEAISRDFILAEKTGIEFIFNSPDYYSIEELKKKYRFVIIASGAWEEGKDAVKNGQEHITDAIRFLENAKSSNYSLDLGKKAAVIGGGSLAIECARAAKKNRGVDSVSVIYRRTREFMPALYEEQKQAIADNITIIELLSTESWEDGILTCEEMVLGDYDQFGRRMVSGTGKKQKLHFDTVISAVGARIDSFGFESKHILLDGNLPVTNANLESSVFDVYIAGNCRTGTAKIADAVADGKIAAADILRKLKIEADFSTDHSRRPPDICEEADIKSLYQKKGVILEAKSGDIGADRCLSCGVLCEICADVCPNRANVSILAPSAGKTQRRQILHMDNMCNECGNCAVFCPSSGRPYKDKLTIFSNEEDFDESENAGFFKTEKNTFKVRLEDKSVVKYRAGEKNIPQEWAFFIETISSKYGCLFP